MTMSDTQRQDSIKIIGFDADDTLWVNESYFREAEEKFADLMTPYETANTVDQELFKIEIGNLPIYGYGIKGFVLSMIESAIELSAGRVSQKTISTILQIGKDMLNKPIELLPGVEECLTHLSKSHRLILATKGDLLDQERKLEKSGLLDHFHHIEVLTEKKCENYSRLLQHLDIMPQEFLMIGNSLKSDILPVIELGSQAIHVPFHTTWQHEEVEEQDLHDLEYQTCKDLLEVLELFG
jgi:putative hydrolase of the HAD superfamily